MMSYSVYAFSMSALAEIIGCASFMYLLITRSSPLIDIAAGIYGGN